MHNILLPILTLLPLAIASSASSEKRDYVGQVIVLTFFGFPDNCDDTGCYNDATAYDCTNPDGTDRGNIAGGDGTFNNPLTTAFQPGGNFQPCQIGYTTYLQKFLIFDGLCASCDTNHLDIWVQSSCGDTPDNVCACEDQLTPDAEDYVYYGITTDDPSVFNVETTALYDESSQSCSGHTYPRSKKERRDTAGQVQSVNEKLKRDELFGVEERWVKSRRQSGACSENSCQCPSC